MQDEHPELPRPKILHPKPSTVDSKQKKLRSRPAAPGASLARLLGQQGFEKQPGILLQGVYGL